MTTRILTSLMVASFACGTAALAAGKLPPKPDASEASFVARIQADLNARFPTPEDARKAGYVRYTNEDATGAISYANRHWTSEDSKHPSQVWYDVKGRLLGADFSVLQSASPQAPSLWGIAPSRWQKIPLHVHYSLLGASGPTYGGMGAKKYAAAGGDPQYPDAAGVVKAGAAKHASDVRFTFAFPSIWDLTVWTLPNPDGAFAEGNPNVTPSATAKSAM
jgi:hypothetical protein